MRTLFESAKRRTDKSNKRHAVLSWAVEPLEARRLLHHQIDATFVPGNPSNPGAGQWIVAAGAQADQNNEPVDAAPTGFVPGNIIPSVALPGLPVLNSDPNAHAAIYLDFNGDAGGQTAYDEDGDPTSFNATEAAHITAAWQSISTYFAPFDVNVTTVKPATAEPTAWGMIGNSISGGYSYVGVFPNVQKFGGPGSFNESSDARNRTSGMAHEYGHNFGLSHQSDYNSLGVKTAEYSSGFNSTHGPIMGVDFAQTVHKWFIGHPSYSNSSLQDDLSVISTAIKNAVGSGDGYRADDYGNTIATATPLTVNGSVQSVSGIIERMSDVDAFSFTSDGTRTMIDVNPTGPSGLAPKVEIYDAAGNLLAAKDDTNQRNGVNNDETLPVDLPAGMYYIMLKSHGDYGDVGQYTVSARPLPSGWNSQDVGGPTTSGDAGYDSATGTFTVAGSGSDIWGTNDQFQYAYQTLSGDGSITARVASQQNTGAWAKAGVMIRETTNGGSKQAMCIVTPSNGVRLQYRASTSGSSTDAGPANSVTAPYWVRLTRSGNSFTAASSPDGVTWTTVSSTTISMNSAVTIGLAVDSTNNGALNTSTFDNVSFTGNVSSAPTYNALPAPAGLTVVPGTSTGLTLNWADVAGETGFTIERSIDGTTWTQVAVTATGVTTYNDNGLYGSMRYFYRVSANDASGKSVPSTDVAAINRPNAPFNLTTESISTTQIVVNWRDVSGETGYRIERSTDGVNFIQIGTVGANVPSYTDSGLTINTNYTYRVTATSAQGDSPVSVVKVASTRLAATTGEAFTTIASGQLALQWSAVAGATGYRIERSTDGSTFSSLATVGAVLSYSDSTVTPLNAYYYRVIGTNAQTESITPAAIFAATPAATVLPTPWQSQDIGSIGGPGAAGFSAGTYTVLANGADIWGNADAMRYAYEPLNGDGSIIARVATQQNTDPWAKAGVMIRESTAAGARQIMVQVTPGNGVHVQYRTATNGGSTDVTGTASVVAPYWVKLTRTGNTFAASSSSDGATWTAVGSVTIAMSTNALIGLAETSHTTTTLNKTTFDNVTVSNNPPTVQNPAAATPAPVIGTTTSLSVLGADDHGEANLTYTWAASGPATTNFTGAANGSNAAKNLTANFTQSGNYTLTCTISDGTFSVTSSTNVTVNQTLTSITVSPAAASVVPGGTTSFSAVANDQFGQPLSAQPSLAWSVTGAGNGITNAGVMTAGTTPGSFTVTAASGAVSGTATATVLQAAIANRAIFYNNSLYDGNDAAANAAADNAAIAPDKSALLPGQAAVFANYTSYDKGINGLILDIANLPAAGVTAADFAFFAGNTTTPGSWAAAPAPASVTVFRGAGVGGSDRIELIWADYSIRNQWLQVTVNANAATTGLATADTFYFGNLVGKTAATTANATVSVGDVASIKFRSGQSASITSPYDLNRDGQIGIGDVVTVKFDQGHVLAFPFTPPAPPAPSAAAAMKAAASAKPSVAQAAYSPVPLLQSWITTHPKKNDLLEV